KDPSHETVRQRRRSRVYTLDSDDGNVGGHDRVDSFGDRGAKRRKIHRIEVSAVRENRWKIKVRIDVGVAMTGKMFSGAHEPGRSRAADVCSCESANQGRIFPEGSRVDYRIQGVRVHVEYRSEHHVHADRAGLRSQ